WKWLELFLEDDSLSLGFVGGTFGRGIRHSVDGPLEGPTPAGTFFRLPLRSPDALRKYHHTSPDVDGAPYPRHETDYEHADEVNGLRWYLHIDDLQREHEFWTAETLPEE